MAVASRFKTWFLEKLALPLGDMALGTSYIHELQNQRDFVGSQLPDLERFQEEKLNKLLDYATENSPHYRKFSNSGSSTNHERLVNFPILSKKFLRENLDQIMTCDRNSENLEITRSSGSTGPHSEIYYTKKEISVPRAISTLWWEWAGYKFGNTVLQTGITRSNRSKVKRIKDSLLNTNYIEAFSHDESEILVKMRTLQSNPVDHFFGYASSIYLFALIAEKHDIHSISFRSISSFGEMLLPEYREKIEHVFNTKVYNTYGSSEGLMIAAECANGNMHTMMPHVLLELLNDEGEEVQPDEIGRVVLTGLDNFTTPLIRYEIGDLARKSKTKMCSCGNAYPLLGEVIGRTNEMLQTLKGSFITVQTIVRIMKHFDEVDRFRFIQHTPDQFELEYKPNDSFHEGSIIEIHKFFNEHLNEELNISFTPKETIERAPSGKIQLIKNAMIHNSVQTV